ncbi:MAG: ATP-binding cassette domain-containing protein [Coleofasciculaceae cyanobacterium SM2_1_6]|nr:ATP-binding cassette domain-containing protein [Coleofasciculaceae cyanobacterium SM2_1_6]
MAKEPLIELKNISKSFGDSKILVNANLTIYRGDALAIIGPSGTGKSTILRIIAGLLAPDAGDVYVQGQKREGLIDDAPDPIGIGMVFQQAALFDSLTVDENVGFLLYQHSRLDRVRIRQLVEEKLGMVGLAAEVADQLPSQLSGGMRKRVSFARAVMANPDNPKDNPEVILYDEPTAGLDPIASTVIEDLVRQLQAEKAGCSSYVMVTHQESTIRRTADRIVFLHQGQVRWSGSVKEIDNTNNPLIKQFFSGSTTGPIQVTG